MENKDLHKIIKSRMESYESPLDLERGWEDLQGRKEKRWKKNNSNLLLMVVIGFLFFVGIGTLNFYYKRIQTEAVQGEETKTNLTTDEEISTSAIVEERLANKQHITIKPSKEKVVLSPMKKLNLGHFSKNKNTSIPAIVHTSSTIQSEKKEPTSRFVPTENSIKKTFILNKSTYEKSNDLILQRKQEKGLNVRQKVETKEKPTQSNSVDPNSSFMKHSGLKELEAIDFVVFPSQEHDLNMNNIKFKRKKSFEFYTKVGIGQTFQNFNSKVGNINGFAKARDVSETSLMTTSLDIGVNYYLTKNTYLGAGLNYFNWNDKFRHSYNQEKEYVLENILLEVITSTSTGEQIEIYGDSIVMGYQETKFDIYNRYNSINMGLVVGHDFIPKRQWNLGVEMGIDWNLQTRVRGQALASSTLLEPVTISDGVYKKSFGLGVKGALKINYQLSNRMRLIFSPNIRYNITSITKSDYLLDTKLYRYGLNVGVGYRFF